MLMTPNTCACIRCHQHAHSPPRKACSAIAEFGLQPAGNHTFPPGFAAVLRNKNTLLSVDIHGANDALLFKRVLRQESLAEFPARSPHSTADCARLAILAIWVCPLLFLVCLCTPIKRLTVLYVPWSVLRCQQYFHNFILGFSRSVGDVPSVFLPIDLHCANIWSSITNH